MISILERLGDPEETLKPLVAGKKLRQATNTFNPKHVIQALSLNIKSSLVFGVFGILYLLLFSFIFIIPVKLFFPSNTGMFFLDDQFKGFGYLANIEGLTEVLGYWIIPMVLAFSTALYFLITLLLRLRRSS